MPANTWYLIYYRDILWIHSLELFSGEIFSGSSRGPSLSSCCFRHSFASLPPWEGPQIIDYNMMKQPKPFCLFCNPAMRVSQIIGDATSLSSRPCGPQPPPPSAFWLCQVFPDIILKIDSACAHMLWTKWQFNRNKILQLKFGLTTLVLSNGQQFCQTSASCKVFKTSQTTSCFSSLFSFQDQPQMVIWFRKLYGVWERIVSCYQTFFHPFCAMLHLCLLMLKLAHDRVLGNMGPGQSGPGQLGPTVRPEKVANWAPHTWAPGPNCLGPDCPW